MKKPMKIPHVRKRVVIGLLCAVGLKFALLGVTQHYVDLSSKKLEEQALSAQTVMDVFAKDKLLTGANRAIVESYHEKGFSFASVILMVTAEAQGRLAERDSVFVEALRLADNTNALQLLVNDTLYDADRRAESLAYAEGLKDNDALRKRMIASATPTLTEPMQKAIKKCSDLLDQRYQGYFSKYVYAYDLAMQTQSCEIPHS